MGSTLFRAIGLKVGVIITIREKLNWICSYLNAVKNQRGCFFKIIRKLNITKCPSIRWGGGGGGVEWGV